MPVFAFQQHSKSEKCHGRESVVRINDREESPKWEKKKHRRRKQRPPPTKGEDSPGNDQFAGNHRHSDVEGGKRYEYEEDSRKIREDRLRAGRHEGGRDSTEGMPVGIHPPEQGRDGL